jgi:preprotein translocase subunit SecA
MIDTAIASTLRPLNKVRQYLWPRTCQPRPHDLFAVQKIRQQTAGLQHVSDDELAAKAKQLQDSVIDTTAPLAEEIVVSGFALVTEAARRALGITLYDVQLLAGLILTGRNVAEMPTGEGKTYVVSLPAFVHSLSGLGVHVATSNDYLAQRDYELLAPVYGLLGRSMGLIHSDLSQDAKRAAYACDITYGADQEFGFDYLRDQIALLDAPKLPPGRRFRLALQGEEGPQTNPVQRGQAVAIIDEVDSVLLDSSVSPLLLSQGSEEAAEEAAANDLARKIAQQLLPAADYSIDTNSRSLSLTEAGSAKLFAGTYPVPQQGLCRPWTSYIEQALKAEHLMRKDVEYVVQEGNVLLVDESTGRIFPERRWRDGLHQAVETKEGVPIHAENRPLGRISKQRYFSLYRHLCGMTGTAQESVREFWRIFKMRVVVVPPRRPCRRVSFPTRIFGTAEAKYAAIAGEIERVHRSGQPVLIGTRTIENSERVARGLEAREVPYQLLNGKQDLDEATIISRAGAIGAVTIATNMAGRGTDIRLQESVAELGGLHVIASEPNESVRVDRQLYGRAARQGDPGSCQLFVSADDLLMRKYGPGLASLLKRLAKNSGEASVDLSTEVRRLQQRVERIQFLSRRKLLQNDNWLQELLAKCAGQSTPAP